jgi:hypothetical protein
MSQEQESQAPQQSLPCGFLLARFDIVLFIIAQTILVSALIAGMGSPYGHWILCLFVVILAVAVVVARRGVRRFVREHGPVEITITFGPDAPGLKKNVMFRPVGELVDKAVDRVLDGKA